MSTNEEIDQMLEDCEDRISKLSEWEVNFVASLRARQEKGYSITDKQDETLEKIWNKVTGG